VLLTAPAESGRLRLPRQGLWEVRREGVRVPVFFLQTWASSTAEELLELEVGPGFYTCCAFPHPAAWVPGAAPTQPYAHGSLPPGGELTLTPAPTSAPAGSR